MLTFLKKHCSIFLILLLASALRINLLLVRGTLWFDEMFSIHYSTLPWGEAIKYWFLETNPFLYNLFLRAYIHIFGQEATIVRIPSIIFALMTIALVYFMAQKFISKRAGIISALIVSLSGIHLFISVETRTYALFVLLTTLSFYWFAEIFINQNTKRSTWISYFLIQLLLLYSHLTALTTIIIQSLLLLYFKDTNRATKRNFILINITALLIWCCWFIPTMIPKINLRTLHGWFFTYEHAGSNVFNTINTLFINAELSDFTFTLFSLVLLGIIFYTLKTFNSQTKKEKDLLTILLIWSLLPPILGAFLGQFVTKYFVFSLPGIAMLVAFGIDKIPDKMARSIIGIIFLILIIPSTTTIATNPIFSWYTITDYVEKNETKNSAILVIPFNEELVIKEYFKGQSPVEGVYPMKDNLKLEERIVRYNWQTLLSSNEEYDQWMEEHTENRDKIFFLQYDGYESNSIIWFINHGWKLNGRVRAAGHIGITMFEFYAPNYHSTTSTASTAKD